MRVDAGTSILLDAQVHEDFHAETAFQAVVSFLRRYGCPSILTVDRDPRWVGSATARDFPSALCQFLLCVGVQPNVLPPRHPELNCYVERYHRTYKEECLFVHRPGTLEEVRSLTEAFEHFYNTQRPHQGTVVAIVLPARRILFCPPYPRFQPSSTRMPGCKQSTGGPTRDASNQTAA
ncbi:hypothetical protein KSC_023240 [Ktedonobacter sp. SOSP1-52]|uniref:integrase core domain-containing protein n=1 Tax=Ktedonobacter sp. SOSP1-52 TaxID=2778366 RepID=UPI001A320BF3|nr:transposase [Ktedonobacter sp. SOSP1-52]GHO63432.1 hypothetical protein KSC_023240 [Ktedonobacter sp. SOSP1-52]